MAQTRISPSGEFPYFVNEKKKPPRSGNNTGKKSLTPEVSSSKQKPSLNNKKYSTNQSSTGSSAKRFTQRNQRCDKQCLHDGNSCSLMHRKIGSQPKQKQHLARKEKTKNEKDIHHCVKHIYCDCKNPVKNKQKEIPEEEEPVPVYERKTVKMRKQVYQCPKCKKKAELSENPDFICGCSNELDIHTDSECSIIVDYDACSDEDSVYEFNYLDEVSKRPSVLESNSGFDFNSFDTSDNNPRMGLGFDTQYNDKDEIVSPSSRTISQSIDFKPQTWDFSVKQKEAQKDSLELRRLEMLKREEAIKKYELDQENQNKLHNEIMAENSELHQTLEKKEKILVGLIKEAEIKSLNLQKTIAEKEEEFLTKLKLSREEAEQNFNRTLEQELLKQEALYEEKLNRQNEELSKSTDISKEYENSLLKQIQEYKVKSVTDIVKLNNKILELEKSKSENSVEIESLKKYRDLEIEKNELQEKQFKENLVNKKREWYEKSKLDADELVNTLRNQYIAETETLSQRYENEVAQYKQKLKIQQDHHTETMKLMLDEHKMKSEYDLKNKSIELTKSFEAKIDNLNIEYEYMRDEYKNKLKVQQEHHHETMKLELEKNKQLYEHQIKCREDNIKREVEIEKQKQIELFESNFECKRNHFDEEQIERYKVEYYQMVNKLQANGLYQYQDISYNSTRHWTVMQMLTKLETEQSMTQRLEEQKRAFYHQQHCILDALQGTPEKYEYSEENTTWIIKKISALKEAHEIELHKTKAQLTSDIGSLKDFASPRSYQVYRAVQLSGTFPQSDGAKLKVTFFKSKQENTSLTTSEMLESFHRKGFSHSHSLSGGFFITASSSASWSDGYLDGTEKKSIVENKVLAQFNIEKTFEGIVRERFGGYFLLFDPTSIEMNHFQIREFNRQKSLTNDSTLFFTKDDLFYMCHSFNILDETARMDAYSFFEKHPELNEYQKLPTGLECKWSPKWFELNNARFITQNF
jgi:hypothetical protein